jgi:hypothetical protein
MNEYIKYVGFGLILGVAIGASFDFISGGFSGISSAIGAGLGHSFRLNYWPIQNKIKKIN